MDFDNSLLLKRGSPGAKRLILSSMPLVGKCASEFSFGIEEEFFLVDQDTLDPAPTTPSDLFEAANWATGGQATSEMLQAQIETLSNIHVSPDDALHELYFLRREAARAASQFGLSIMACGTHPTARWQDMTLTRKTRYEDMIDDLQQVGRRNMLCGMHVHVQLPAGDARYQVMCAMTPYVPIFIALAASSPFWNGVDTGLKGYRLAAYDELPRTGLPEPLCTERDYDRYVEAMVQAGAIPDATHIWWTLRPSPRHPTLELRAPDCCTRAEDAVSIAMLYRALARHLVQRLPAAEIGPVDRALAAENKWRAQRYGTECVLVTRDGQLTLAQAIDQLIDRVQDDAAALGCMDEVLSCRRIVERGSSADHQLATVKDDPSLQAAKRWIHRETLAQ